MLLLLLLMMTISCWRLDDFSLLASGADLESGAGISWSDDDKSMCSTPLAASWPSELASRIVNCAT